MQGYTIQDAALVVAEVTVVVVVEHCPHKIGQYKLIDATEHCDVVKLMHSIGWLLQMRVSQNKP